MWTIVIINRVFFTVYYNKQQCFFLVRPTILGRLSSLWSYNHVQDKELNCSLFTRPDYRKDNVERSVAKIMLLDEDIFQRILGASTEDGKRLNQLILFDSDEFRNYVTLTLTVITIEPGATYCAHNACIRS